MADPTPYERGYSFTNYQADTPDQPLPGNRLDIELDNIAENSRVLTDTVNAGFKVDANLEDIVKVGDEIDKVVFVADNMPDVRDAAGVAPYVQRAIELFLGGFPEDPTTGTNGDPLTVGATYYNTVVSQSFVWTGSAWVPIAQVSVGGVLQGSLIVSGGATTFTIGDYVSVTVARNGRVLRPGVEFTTASPDIVVPSAADGDEITWFGILKGSITDAATFVRQTILTTTATRYSTNTDGQPLNLTPTNHILFGASPFAVMTYGVDYTVDAGDPVFSFTPKVGELYHVFSMPRFTNTEAQAVLQDLEDRVGADATIAAGAAASNAARSIYGGTSNAITITGGFTALQAGMRIRFRATAANNGSGVTLNLDGLGARPCVTVTGAALPAAYIRTNADTEATYDGTNWVLDREAEVGGNANGRFCRLANGTLTCWGFTTTSATGAVSVTFPATFVSSNAADSVIVTNGVNSTAPFGICPMFSGMSNTGMSVFAYRSSTDALVATRVTFTATGPWY